MLKIFSMDMLAGLVKISTKMIFATLLIIVESKLHNKQAKPWKQSEYPSQGTK